ncbi:MAG: hypothetical protein ACRDO4_02810 [Nocardioides sp.]
MSLLAHPVRIRRLVAGTALIGCALAGTISSVFDANEGTDTSGHALYGIALEHHEGIWIAGLVFIVSAILTVPAAFGLLHLSAGRGATLGHWGVVFLILGAFGHMGYGTWQLMVSAIPGAGERSTLVDYFERASVVNGVLLPLQMSIIVGLILTALAARRSGRLPRWVPGLLIAVAVFDFIASSTALGTSKWTPVVTWSMALVALSYVGAVVIRMSDQAWADLYPRSMVFANAVTS